MFVCHKTVCLCSQQCQLIETRKVSVIYVTNITLYWISHDEPGHDTSYLGGDNSLCTGPKVSVSKGLKWGNNQLLVFSAMQSV